MNLKTSRLLIAGMAAVCFAACVSTVSSLNAQEPPASSLYQQKVQPTRAIAVNPLAGLAQQDPSGLLERDAVAATEDGNSGYSSRQNRAASPIAVSWRQPELRHRRLFFEDAAIERCNSPRKFGNLASGMHFFNSLFRLPLRIANGR